MRIAHLIAGAAVAALTSLAFTTPASADNPALPINPAHLDKTAAEFDGDTCDEPFDTLKDDQDGWHFVLKGGGSFVSLSLTFEKPGGGTVNVLVDSKDAGAPSSGAGWEGYIDNAGASGADKHVYLFADAGWKLTAATASVTGEGDQSTFNLSHTCAGTPSSESPSPDPSDPESPDPSTSASTPGGNLPTTGTQVGGFVIAGVALLAGGVALLAVRRRRQIAEG